MIKEAGVGPFKKDVCESYKQLDLVCVNLERKMWREREREREREGNSSNKIAKLEELLVCPWIEVARPCCMWRYIYIPYLRR